MNETKIALLPLWKGKYTVNWCHLCGCAHIICPDCKNSSCNGGGCDSCITDELLYSCGKFKIYIEDYLSPEEIKIYHKCEKLKELILECIAEYDSNIDFKRLEQEGKLSEITKEMFKKELE